MFYPIIGGTKIKLANPNDYYDIWIPPIPDKSKILGYSLPREEQLWKRQPLPHNFEERYQEEKHKREIELELVLNGDKESITHVDPILERYRRQEYHRRKWGVWFMNDGVPTYITGHHYFSLQYGKADHKRNDGYPLYYEFARDAFYFRQWCEENPKSLGYLIVGPRGTGKSQDELSCILNNTTIRKEAKVALQSKSFEHDAQPILFQSKLVLMFNNLPEMFKPIYSHGTAPVDTMIFKRPSKRGKEAKNIRFGKELELNSYIYAVRPGEKVLDGQTMSEVLEDEIGKCLGPETKVLLSDGSIKEAQNVCISDKLMGMDSSPRNISEIKLGIDYSYKIIPKKSGWSSWTCSSGHKMCLAWGNRTRDVTINGKNFKYGDNIIVTIDSFLKLNKTIRRHLMLFRKPVSYQYKKVWIDPYLLGLWLGDGNKSNMAIWNMDHEVIDHIKNTYGSLVRVVKRNDGLSKLVIKSFHGILRHYGLKRNKHIPNDFLINDRKSRLELLAGIIDTDGHATIQGNKVNCEITQKLKVLAIGIHKLATELGFNCSIVEKIATMKRKDGTVFRGLVYRMNIFGDLHEIPTKIKRKQFPKIHNHHKNRKDPQRCGFSVEPIGLSPYVGFVLDGDKIHLLGDCQVTHNTNPAEVADIYKRHEVNRKVVFRNHQKVGMLRKTTTVEEMREGGRECHELWKDSDPKNTGDNGWTVSQIHRYFISALTTDTSPECCDKYGRVNRELANQKIENTIALIKHDLQKVSSELRKNPRNETEAFIIDQSKSVFNTMLLTSRLNHIRNEMAKPPYIRGNFYWLKDKFQKVWFQRDDYAGRFNIAWLPDEFSQIKEPDKAKVINNVSETWGWDSKGKSRKMLSPMNDHLFRIGTDPIKFSKTKDPRASKAAAHGFRLYDGILDYGKPKEQWQSHNFIFEYINRPEDPETYFEDMAMACIFFGCKILPERNVPSLNQYFELNGLERFLAYPKQFLDSGVDIQIQSDDAGYASSPEVIDYYTRRLITYINQHISRCPFDNTIEDWLNFDSTNPTKFDATVSSGFTLVHAEKIALNPDEKPEETLDDWFDAADNSGTVGTFVETQTERYGT